MTAQTAKQSPFQVTEKSLTMPGVNVMLMGPAGTGKTHSIGTAVDAGVEVFYFGLENGLEALKGYWTDRGQPIPDNLRWHILKAPSLSFLDMQESARKINTLSLESLAKMTDPDRGKHNQFIEVYSVLNNFVDQRTGKAYGTVLDWKSDRLLAIDGMTGLSNAALSLVTGGKPVRSQSDWGIAQVELEKLLRKLCDDCPCHLVVLAHVEREVDPVLGGVKIMPSTLGKALAPKIPAMFSDVILAVRQGTAWTWDTSNALADLKTRNLPIKADNKPDFLPILLRWKTRAEAA